MNTSKAIPLELGLDVGPVTDACVESERIIECYPTAAVAKNATVEFAIPEAERMFVDLRHTTLKVGVKITKSGGGILDDTDNAALIDLPLHSIFAAVDVTLGQQSFPTGVGNNYPYKAHLDAVAVGVGNEDELACHGFTNEFKSRMDNADANMGKLVRKKWTELGKTVYFEGTLFADICQQNRYIPSVAGLRMKLWQTSDEFRLMGVGENPDYEMELIAPVLKVNVVQLTDGGMRHLKGKDFLYPYERSVIKTYNVANGLTEFNVENAFSGHTPKRLIAAVVSAVGYSGSQKRYPFNYNGYNVSHVEYNENGRSIPGPPLTQDYNAKNFISTYRKCFSGGCTPRIPGSPLDSRYYEGFAFYVFDIAGQRMYASDDGERNLSRFSVKFQTPLTEAVTVILYATFDDMFQLENLF